MTWHGGGNVPPVLGLARRLAARGHSVRVLTEPCLKEAVLTAGARFVRFTRYFTREDATANLPGDWQARSALCDLRRVLDRIVFGPARIVAEETHEAIETAKPDVVVADFLMPGALIAAEGAGIPRVALFHTPDFLPGPGRPVPGPGWLPRHDLIGALRDEALTRLLLSLLGARLRPFNDARRALGLAPLRTPQSLIDQYHRADLRLIQTSEAFDFPMTPSPHNVRYVGPILDDPDWTSPWQNPWPAADARPLVVASLSSIFQDQRGALLRMIAALGALDVRGLVTLGPAMANEQFHVPRNVITVASAPHSLVFPQAAAVVTHAGHGTVMRALAHGLPLLCLPMGRDQDDNAARVVAHGAGLRLRPSAKPPRIAAAIQSLLNGPGYKASAIRLGRIIQSDVAAERAVKELEAI